MKQHLSLQELAAEVQRVRDEKRDFRVDTGRHLEVKPVLDDDQKVRAGQLEFVVQDEQALAPYGAFQPTRLAHSQIVQKVGDGWKWGTYYRAMLEEDPALLAYSLNRHFRRQPQTRLLRTLGEKLRGVLGPTYRPLENADLMAVLLEEFHRQGLFSKLDFDRGACALTESKLYVKAFWPGVQKPTKVGDVVMAGFAFGNSEVGDGSIWAAPQVLILSCINGMRSPAPGLHARHVGRRITAEERVSEVFTAETIAADDRALILKARDVILKTADETQLEKVVKHIDAASEDRIESGVQEVVEVVGNRYDLSQGDQKNILDYLAEGGDLSRWGVAQAITRYSQDVEEYERADELEKIGWRVTELPSSQWRTINEDAKQLREAA